MRLLDSFRALADSEARAASYVKLYESWASNDEPLETSFASYVAEGYKQNGVVFAVILARMMLLSEVRFANRSDRTDELSRTGRNLAVLNRPWANGRTSDLVARMEQDASLGGNAYVLRVDAPSSSPAPTTTPARLGPDRHRRGNGHRVRVPTPRPQGTVLVRR